MPRRISVDNLLDNYVANVGNSCTTVATLTALGALGATGLPDIGTATQILSNGGTVYQPPRVTDYIAIPFLRRAPVDVRIEKLAAAAGIRVRASTRLCLTPFRVAMPRAGEVVIGNMAYGQESPGRWGFWGFNPFKPASWAVAGHSLIVAGRHARGWTVVDSNNPGAQQWSRPGLAVTTTRIRGLD